MSTSGNNEIGKAVARPTKNFFVHMLTRDIELQDALLDLLDNCIDGVIRSRPTNDNTESPYEGFGASITMAPDYFVIEDNCGGIPFDVAKRYAFAIGKPFDAETAEQSSTIGMYGIGMKRAIFKLGREALVESHHDTGFVAEFTPEWMSNDNWDDLPLYEQKTTIRNGTLIQVHELHDEASKAFSDGIWIDEFRKTVSRHYSLIIKKGFSVTIGNPDEIVKKIAPIQPEDFRFLETPTTDGNQITPFVFYGERNGVSIEIYAGIYRELLREEDADLEEETRGYSEDAGWTIACNDRIVVWKDKTRLTGWGESTVPNFHGQFIAITGIVLLSGEPSRLPLTTTKRGIDAASNLYSEIKDMMRDATKALTSFTNRWKKFPKMLGSIYKESEYIDLSAVRARASEMATITSRRYPGIKKNDPSYPLPQQEKSSSRISFVALKADLEILGKHFFGDQKFKPGEVGEAAFNESLESVKEKAK
jgi:hypothetical protein